MTLAALSLLTATNSPDAAAETVDLLRNLHGLSSVVRDQHLDKAAQGHARYMLSNRDVQHTQESGTPFFTGRTLSDRVLATGFDGPASELIGYSSVSVRDTTVAIFGSPYHRSAFLVPGKVRAGIGVAGNYVCLILSSPSQSQIVLSPPEGAKSIPMDWPGGSGFPATQGPYGYPIVARLGAPEDMIKSAEFSLEHKGRPVPIILHRMKQSPTLSGCLTAVPKRPLLRGQDYDCRLTVKLVNGQSKTVTWSYQTEG